MRNAAVETIERDGFVARLYYDEDPQSLKDWDNLGTLVTWHRRYCWDQDGAKVFGSVEEFLERAKEEGWVVVPVGMYEHSGVTLYAGHSNHAFDPQGWDSGAVGFIYATKESIEKIGTPADRVEEVLRQEIEIWDQYVRGDVYYYEIENASGDSDPDHSCGGLYGFDYAVEEMKSALEGAIGSASKELAEMRVAGSRF